MTQMNTEVGYICALSVQSVPAPDLSGFGLYTQLWQKITWLLKNSFIGAV